LLFLKAAILVSANRLDEAKAICDKLKALDPNNTDALELSAVISKAQGNKAARSQEISALLQKDPNNVQANVELADDALLQRNYKGAQSYYTKALVREPNNEQALVGYGQTCYFMKDDDKAVELFNTVIKENPQNDQAYYYLGKLAYADSRYQVASQYVQKAIAIDGGNYDYYLDYGMYERFLGDFDVAEKAWTKAIEIEPDYFLAYVYRAGLYDEQNMFKQALSDYLQIVKVNPDYYYAYESIGILSLHDKNWSGARKAFMKCYEYNASNVSYPLMITYCYYMDGDKVNAKKFSDSVLRKMDRNSVEYVMLRAYHDETDKLPLLQRISAMTNSNQRGKMYFYLGLLYDMFGGKELATQYYTKVVDMQSPMFFEYRIAEWNTGKGTDEAN
jgi:tetratricopeptide (TPR) repeat protein